MTVQLIHSSFHICCVIGSKTWQHFLKRFSELLVGQSVNKWVATAVQHGQCRGDTEKTVGEWARAVCECQTHDSNEMRQPAENKGSIHNNKDKGNFHLFPKKKK